MAFTVVTRFRADVSDHIAGTRKASAETRAFSEETKRASRSVQQSASANVAAATTRLQRGQELLTQYRMIEAASVKGSAQQLAAARLIDNQQKKLAVTTAATAKSFGSLGQSIQGASQGFRGGGGFGQLGVASLAAVGGAAIKTAADFEQTEIAFEGLLGSAERAQQFLAELQDFAARTPFEFPQLTKAAQQLMATGTAAEDVIPVLTKIGNVTSALGVSGEGIDRVVRALGQMQGRGKVASQELIQISEAIPGFSAIGAIAEHFGITTAEAFKKVETGGVSAQEGIEAILSGMERFPGAAGAMERQSQTLNGQLSTLKDNLRLLAIDGLSPVLPFIKGHIQQLSFMVNMYGDVIKRIGQVKEAADNMKIGPVSVGSVAFPSPMGLVSEVAGWFAEEDTTELAAEVVSATSRMMQGITALGKAAKGTAVDAEVMAEALMELPRAEMDVDRAHRSLSDAQEELNELLARGPVDAEKLADAEQNLASTSRSLESAQRGLTDAQERLDELLARGPVDMERVAQAEDRTVAASERLTDAQETLTDAQERLNEVIAGSTIEELTRAELRARSATLSLAGAKLSVAEAQERLVEAYKSGDQLEIERADLGLQQAKLGVEDATNGVEDAEKELIDTRDRGKPGTEEREQAERDVESARRGVRDATKDVSAAERELDEARAGDPDFTRQVSDAELAVSDARWGVEQASRARNEAEAEWREARKGDPGYLDQIRGLQDEVKDATFRVAETELGLAVIRNTIAGESELTHQQRLQHTIDLLKGMGGEMKLLAEQLEVQYKFNLTVEEAREAILGIGSTIASVVGRIARGEIKPQGDNIVLDSSGKEIGRYAKGGRLTAGMSGIVGEGGRPELVTMDRYGGGATITPLGGDYMSDRQFWTPLSGGSSYHESNSSTSTTRSTVIRVEGRTESQMARSFQHEMEWDYAVHG